MSNGVKVEKYYDGCFFGDIKGLLRNRRRAYNAMTKRKRANNDEQKSIKKTKYLATRTYGTRRVTLITNPMVRHEW